MTQSVIPRSPAFTGRQRIQYLLNKKAERLLGFSYLGIDEILLRRPADQDDGPAVTF